MITVNRLPANDLPAPKPGRDIQIQRGKSKARGDCAACSILRNTETGEIVGVRLCPRCGDELSGLDVPVDAPAPSPLKRWPTPDFHHVDSGPLWGSVVV